MKLRLYLDFFLYKKWMTVKKYTVKNEICKKTVMSLKLSTSVLSLFLQKNMSIKPVNEKSQCVIKNYLNTAEKNNVQKFFILKLYIYCIFI